MSRAASYHKFVYPFYLFHHPDVTWRISDRHFYICVRKIWQLINQPDNTKTASLEARKCRSSAIESVRSLSRYPIKFSFHTRTHKRNSAGEMRRYDFSTFRRLRTNNTRTTSRETRTRRPRR